MEIITKWSVVSTDYEIDTGKILRIHYSVDTSDGVSTYHSYGTVTIVGAVVVPFQAITELLLIEWVKDELGESEVEAIETTHLEKLQYAQEKRKGEYAQGLPWK